MSNSIVFLQKFNSIVDIRICIRNRIIYSDCKIYVFVLLYTIYQHLVPMPMCAIFRHAAHSPDLKNDSYVGRACIVYAKQMVNFISSLIINMWCVILILRILFMQTVSRTVTVYMIHGTKHIIVVLTHRFHLICDLITVLLFLHCFDSLFRINSIPNLYFHWCIVLTVYNAIHTAS